MYMIHYKCAMSILNSIFCTVHNGYSYRGGDTELLAKLTLYPVYQYIQ